MASKRPRITIADLHREIEAVGIEEVLSVLATACNRRADDYATKMRTKPDDIALALHNVRLEGMSIALADLSKRWSL